MHPFRHRGHIITLSDKAVGGVSPHVLLLAEG